jgi:hypothetical protein
MTIREENSGFAHSNMTASPKKPVANPEMATSMAGPRLRWAAAVRLAWNATVTPTITAITTASLKRASRNVRFVPIPNRSPPIVSGVFFSFFRPRAGYTVRCL